MYYLRMTLGAVLGIFLGGFAMIQLHNLGMLIWPEAPYPGENVAPEVLHAWMEGLSLQTKLFATFAHWAGTATAACLAVLFSPNLKSTGQRSMVYAWIAGGWYTIGGAANAYMMGTPVWLSVLDLVGYIPAAYFTGRSMVSWLASRAASSVYLP